MKILNYGSLNLDHVYQLEEFVLPGQTIACKSYEQFYGGKGLNQSIALAKAGAEVYHGGQIGADGTFLRTYLDKNGVKVNHINECDTATGHAIIQVNDNGENAIIINGGANQKITEKEIEGVIQRFSDRDMLLIQNEISNVDLIIKAAKRQGMTVAFNPAPMTADVLNYPLDEVDIFILNETEITAITGRENLVQAISAAKEKFPSATIISTQGAKGVRYIQQEQDVFYESLKVTPVDTTAAGDTFIGFFLAALCGGKSPEASLQLANTAAAISVTRPGAADSIPSLAEVIEYLPTNP